MAITESIVSILENALEASESTGFVEVVLSSEITKGVRNAKLTIRDFGLGISPALYDKIFTPFTTKKDKKGIGLSGHGDDKKS